MAIFSQNQVRHFYVAKSCKSTNGTTHLNGSESAGTIAALKDTVNENLYFEYMGPGGQTRTDLVPFANIKSVSAVDARSLRRNLTKYVVSLDPSINSGLPISGQDYILNIQINRYVGMSDEDIQNKFGIVHGYSGMTAEQFYQTMVKSLENNFIREACKIFSFGYAGTYASKAMKTNAGITVTANNIGTAGNKLKFAVDSINATTSKWVESIDSSTGVKTITASLKADDATIGGLKTVMADNKDVTISGTSATAVLVETTAVALTGGATTGVTVEEYPQPWILGRYSQVPVYFVLRCDKVLSGGEDLNWGVVSKASSSDYISNGKEVADMEYFYLGERGDQYRNLGFPDSLATTYLADPTLEYSLIDINYFYKGDNESVQESDKTVTIAVPSVGTTAADKNALANNIIAAINADLSGNTTKSITALSTVD